MSRSIRLPRRQFLGTLGAAAVAGPSLFHRAVFGAEGKSPNDRITLGFIGVGTMGRGHLNAFLGDNDVQVVAVCDVVAERRDDAKAIVEKRYAERTTKGEFKGCDTYNDFRQLLERKDIDAVVIATPDHWHAIPVVRAAQAGKHIYCEKPLTHNIAEGRKIVETVAAKKVIFQTGSQQRSEFGGKFRLAADLIRHGRIGKVKTIRIGVGAPSVACDLPEQSVPDGTDWEMWLGPAPQRGYSDVLCPRGIHKHFPQWRAYREYAGGGVADMGAHHFDIAQWALEMDGSGPVKVEPPADGKNTGLKLTYANGVEMFHGGPSGCTFEGTEGTIYVDRGTMTSTPGGILETPLGESDRRVYLSENHRRNWLDCIRTGKEPICPAEVGHRTATVCHLVNLGYRLQRPLTWDPAKEEFADDAEANALRTREPRGDWTL